VTDLVNTEHVVDKQQDAMRDFLGPMWCTKSIVLIVKDA